MSLFCCDICCVCDGEVKHINTVCTKYWWIGTSVSEEPATSISKLEQVRYLEDRSSRLPRNAAICYQSKQHNISQNIVCSLKFVLPKTKDGRKGWIYQYKKKDKCVGFTQTCILLRGLMCKFLARTHIHPFSACKDFKVSDVWFKILFYNALYQGQNGVGCQQYYYNFMIHVMLNHCLLVHIQVNIVHRLITLFDQ
jgi:hypothetical protein